MDNGYLEDSITEYQSDQDLLSLTMFTAERYISRG